VEMDIKKFRSLKKKEKKKVKKERIVKWSEVLEMIRGRVVSFREVRDLVVKKYGKREMYYSEWYRIVSKWIRNGVNIDVREDSDGRVWYGIDISEVSEEKEE